MTVDCLTTTNNIQHDIWRKNNMTVINSFLKPDGLDRGKHIGHMGYRFNATFNIESCGTITMVNSLVALKKLVYEDKKYTLDEMREAIKPELRLQGSQGNRLVLADGPGQTPRWRQVRPDPPRLPDGPQVRQR
jgi:hypothetical protein